MCCNQINMRIVSGSDKHSNGNQVATSDELLFMTSQTAISHWTDEGKTKFKKFVNENESHC